MCFGMKSLQRISYLPRALGRRIPSTFTILCCVLKGLVMASLKQWRMVLKNRYISQDIAPPFTSIFCRQPPDQARIINTVLEEFCNSFGAKVKKIKPKFSSLKIPSTLTILKCTFSKDKIISFALIVSINALNISKLS